MKIMQNSFAVFWRLHGKPFQQFHADLYAQDNAIQAVTAFKEMFPADIVCSVRDKSGRFIAFKSH